MMVSRNIQRTVTVETKFVWVLNTSAFYALKMTSSIRNLRLDIVLLMTGENAS
jgi:hypothetical protein